MLLIKRGQLVGEDGLSLSVASSQMQSSLRVFLKKYTIKSFVLTCQWPAPLYLVASKGMVNQPFHVPRHVGRFTVIFTPLCFPEGSKLSGASRNTGCTPCCCVIPHAPFSKCPPTP